MLIALAATFLVPQQPAAVAPPAPLVAALAPAAAGDKGGPRWSPKGATVPLTLGDQGPTGSFTFGTPDAPAVTVRLQKSAGAAHYDQLWLDTNRDGKLADDEKLTTTPKEQRGKWWSSFTSEIAIPVAAEAGKPATTRPYPLNLWFVEDPQEPNAQPALRWSRHGWHEGTVEIAGKPALVMITEMEMDGVFDQRDSWALARERSQLFTADSRSMERHVWFDGVAYRPTSIDAHGRSLTFERCDPGMTEAEEKAKADVYKADREAPRAAKPLAFGGDLAAALATAKQDKKRVFIDFQTTWCGPCRQMEQMVYTAAAVVTAADGVIAVKLDGDEQRELVKSYGVAAYPTMLLLDQDGNELKRAVGYRSVAAMVEFFKP